MKEAPLTSFENRDPEESAPLTRPVFHILLSLADGDRHRYGLTREIKARTRGSIGMGPGTLRQSLVRLLDEGMIEDVGGRVDPNTGKTRRYHGLTDFGRQVLLAEFRYRENEVEKAREKLRVL